MKVRKNLLLNRQAVAAGEKLVKAGAAASLSELVEKQLQVAAAMDWKASFIITGNVRDFKRSPIPALAPAAWIKRFEPDLGN